MGCGRAPCASASSLVRKGPEPSLLPCPHPQGVHSPGSRSVCEWPWTKPSPQGCPAGSPRLLSPACVPLGSPRQEQTPSRTHGALQSCCGGLLSGPGAQRHCPRAGQPPASRAQCSRPCPDDRGKATTNSPVAISSGKGWRPQLRGSLKGLLQTRIPPGTQLGEALTWLPLDHGGQTLKWPSRPRPQNPCPV